MFRFVLKWMVIGGFLATANGLSCLDGNANSVDWYYMYKVPKMPDSPNPLIKAGQAFFYLGEHYPSKWTLSDIGIESPQQPVYQTLEQIYTNPDPTMMFLVYNDQVLNKQKGHTKGALAFTKTQGFWLTHSVPNFPPLSGKKWPDSASKYGHTFLCMSFPFSELESIVTQLWHNYLEISKQNVPEYFIDRIPRLADVIGGTSLPQSPYNSEVWLTSLQGFEFVSFAKSENFERDLYDGLVAPSLGVDLLVQSWLRTKKLNSTCTTPYKVMNVNVTKLSSDVTFPSSADHSKWAVSTTQEWVCIGDIDRMESQFKRGGGAVCLSNRYVWQAFKDSVTEYEVCNNSQPGWCHGDDEELYLES